MAGLGGSLHCVGMCGGLVAACAPTKKSIATYQVGRLFGYLLLGLIGGAIGSLLRFRLSHGESSLLAAFSIGALLIYWGVQSYRGKKAEMPLPKFVEKTHRSLWIRSMNLFQDQNSAKSMSVGFLSILLPCGMLYGVIISVSALQSPALAAMLMFFFWLGTLPAMGLAPGIIQKVIKPIFKKAPKLSSIFLIAIGLSTISFRVWGLYQEHFCH
ncbi:sulfite exporter TauE/SafE family protein [Halobacteriovorax sp. GB3]|uniref:sulfite exporter TauE/SafE family protein n=1 Tax=Halobacteriovorax sp. GB3 TaxID=2719615 RepID=UPI00235FD603|nr:sulfite exporter TauE/SafE family protein [Halobacteriovorax sp. GB3]MDD0853401.1 sulfite exporter TauE/SafE family protein [Halobacteriovorax sp. GB3]